MDGCYTCVLDVPKTLKGETVMRKFVLSMAAVAMLGFASAPAMAAVVVHHHHHHHVVVVHHHHHVVMVHHHHAKVVIKKH